MVYVVNNRLTVQLSAAGKARGSTRTSPTHSRLPGTAGSPAGGGRAWHGVRAQGGPLVPCARPALSRPPSKHRGRTWSRAAGCKRTQPFLSAEGTLCTRLPPRDLMVTSLPSVLLCKLGPHPNPLYAVFPSSPSRKLALFCLLACFMFGGHFKP